MVVNPNLPTVGGDTGAWGEKLNDSILGTATEVNTHEGATDPHGDRAYADTTKLSQSNNLADLADANIARVNLGLGTAALSDAGDFVTSLSLSQAISDALAASKPVNL